MNRKLISLCLLPLLVCGQWALDFDEEFARAVEKRGYGPLTFTWIDAVPASITLGASYSGPADWDKAEYDSGGGWTKYSGDKTLPIVSGNKIRFRGDWRDSFGIYAYSYMFQNTFGTYNGPLDYPCIMSGRLEYPCPNSHYKYMFTDCNNIIQVKDWPFPKNTWEQGMEPFHRLFFRFTYFDGTLPEGAFDTSMLTSIGSSYRLYDCFTEAKVRGVLPKGMFDTRNMVSTGWTKAYGFSGCVGFSSKSDKMELPEGFLDLSGFTVDSTTLGSIIADSPFGGGGGQWVIGNHNFRFGAGMEFTPENVTFLNKWLPRSTNWTGQVYWGDDLLVNKIPVPAQKTTVFKYVTGMPGWAELHPYWKDMDVE